MIMSCEETLSILKKWESEETPLCALVSVHGASFSLAGFIASLNSSLITVRHLTREAEKLGEFTIPFCPFRAFEYRDVREVKTRVDARLVCALKLAADGMVCIFYELNDRNRDW